MILTSAPHFAIAIDGPAASGKSTFSRQLAQVMTYIDADIAAMSAAENAEVGRG